MTWPPAYPSPYHNLTKAEQAEYDAVVERDGELCIACGHGVQEVHHVVFRSQGGPTKRENMVCLCLKCHGRSSWGAHGENAKRYREKYLAYLEEVK